jgi:RNA recognition motif-containing protein
VRIITDRDTNLCKGYAFIGFMDKHAAMAAMNGLDGYRMDGKVLTGGRFWPPEVEPPHQLRELHCFHARTRIEPEAQYVHSCRFLQQ